MIYPMTLNDIAKHRAVSVTAELLVIGNYSVCCDKTVITSVVVFMLCMFYQLCTCCKEIWYTHTSCRCIAVAKFAYRVLHCEL